MSERPPNESHPTRADLGSDDQAIQYAIAEAQLDNRLIDDATARRIAMQFHDGQGSALYSLASTGALDREKLANEMMIQLVITHEDQDTLFLGVLAGYVVHNEDRGPIPGWYLLTADDMPVVSWVETVDPSFQRWEKQLEDGDA